MNQNALGGTIGPMDSGGGMMSMGGMPGGMAMSPMQTTSPSTVVFDNSVPSLNARLFNLTDEQRAAVDAILKETGCRLRACARKSDVVCRIGGDEFIVLIEKLLTPQLVEFFVERMLAKLAEDFVCTDQVYSINASIGVSIYPLDGGDLETLIHNADSAMYEVKKRGRNGWRFYNAALRHETEKSKGKQWFPG